MASMLWPSILTATERTVVAFVLALVVTWLLNKQFVARMTYFDFTLGVMIGSLVAHIPNDFRDPFWPVAVPTVMIAPLGILTSWLAMRFQGVRHLLQGEPTVVIQNGKILEQNMRRLRYNQDQLDSQLRISGVFDIGHVEFAVLEPGGQLSVLLKSQHRPVRPADLQVPTGYEGMAIELITDGQVVAKNLGENNLSRQWLQGELHRRGIAGPEAVAYAVLDSRGRLFVDLYDDALHRPVDVEGRNPSTPPSPALPGG